MFPIVLLISTILALGLVSMIPSSINEKELRQRILDENSIDASSIPAPYLNLVRQREQEHEAFSGLGQVPPKRIGSEQLLEVIGELEVGADAERAGQLGLGLRARAARPTPQLLQEMAGEVRRLKRELASRKGLENEIGFRLVIVGLITGAVGCCALYIIASHGYGDADKKWAYGTVGTVLGYWIRR